uniref:Metalloendopeptidase n=1 Tax=Strongyloides venezuelensis TaxID=75913 RepID=A0A0K0FJU6_STRVS
MMSKFFLFFILLAICFPQDILGKKKKKPSKKLSELKPRFNNTISYYVDNSMFKYETFIQNIFKQLETSGCLKFEQKKTEIKHSGINYFLTSNKTDIIRYDDLNKPTNIYLTNSDLSGNYRLPYFLTGMALGLIPELTRYDRDEYVTVYLKNVDPFYMKFYKKETIKRDYLGSFDYGSIMLLSNSFARKSSKPTYTYKLYPHYDHVIELFDGFTVNDHRRLYFMYCKDKCPNLEKCHNRGWPLDDCGGCVCYHFHFERLKCESYPMDNNLSCGRKYYRSFSKKLFISRKSLNDTCSFIIESPKKKKISITIKSLTFLNKPSCVGYEGLHIYYQPEWSGKPFYLCYNATNITLPPLSKKIYIRYYTYGRDFADFTIMYHDAYKKQLKSLT